MRSQLFFAALLLLSCDGGVYGPPPTTRSSAALEDPAVGGPCIDAEQAAAMDGGQPLIFSGVGAACGNNEGQFLECDAGLECVYPENVAPGTLGTCEEPHDSGLGQECGDDITIQKKCADGLVCVFPPGGPFSEHTPGHCEVVAPQHRSEDLSFSRAHPGLLSRRSAVRALGEGCDDDSQCAADAFCDILAMPLDDTPQGVCTEIQCGFAHP